MLQILTLMMMKVRKDKAVVRKAIMGRRGPVASPVSTGPAVIKRYKWLAKKMDAMSVQVWMG